MHLFDSSTAIALLLATIVPSIVASPLEEIAAVQYRNPLLSRASTLQLSHNRQCVNPAQISLVEDPGLNALGSCGWKMWVACTSLAAGACIWPCSAGGLADPACDACLVALGTLGCKNCIENQQVQVAVMDQMVEIQPRVVAKLQREICDVPKREVKMPAMYEPKPTKAPSAQQATA